MHNDTEMGTYYVEPVNTCSLFCAFEFDFAFVWLCCTLRFSTESLWDLSFHEPIYCNQISDIHVNRHLRQKWGNKTEQYSREQRKELRHTNALNENKNKKFRHWHVIMLSFGQAALALHFVPILSVVNRDNNKMNDYFSQDPYVWRRFPVRPQCKDCQKVPSIMLSLSPTICTLSHPSEILILAYNYSMFELVFFREIHMNTWITNKVTWLFHVSLELPSYRN